MSIDVWSIGFPGVRAADDRRLLRLALIALMEPPGEGDPLWSHPAGRVARACECQPQRARWAVQYLREKGWVVPDGALATEAETVPAIERPGSR
jgi:hypothetical protein